MDTENGGASPEAFERLNAEIARLRASRERLVLAADADRRLLERELHQGVQQRLVALAITLQLAEEALSLDGAAAATRLRDAGRELERALDDATRLAERIHPPLLDAGGLAAALRTAATRAGTPTSVDVAANCSPEIATTVYRCCLAAVGMARPGGRAEVSVREGDLGIVFEVTAEGGSGSGGTLDGLEDGVEALGGWLTFGPTDGGGIHLSGSLPPSR